MANNCFDNNTSGEAIAGYAAIYKRTIISLNASADPKNPSAEAGGTWDDCRAGVEYRDDLYSTTIMKHGLPGGETSAAPSSWASAADTWAGDEGYLQNFTDSWNAASSTHDKDALVKTFKESRSSTKFKCGQGSVEEAAKNAYDEWLRQLAGGVDGAEPCDPPSELLDDRAKDEDGNVVSKADWEEQQAENTGKCDRGMTLLGRTLTDEERAEACKERDEAVEALKAYQDAAGEAVMIAMSQRRNIQFKEQCFLLGELFNLVAYKQQLDQMIDLHVGPETPMYPADVLPANRELKRLPYESKYQLYDGNASLLMQGDAFAFINKLTQNIKKKATFFDMSEAEISSLQPLIRLFKIVSNTTTGAESQVEMKFETHMTNASNPGSTSYPEADVMSDMDLFLSPSSTRGTGVGIKNFTVSYEADNPFAIKKSIKARLVLHANNFDELLRERIDRDSGFIYSYIDLALKTGGTTVAMKNLNTYIHTNKLNPQQADEAWDNLAKLMFRLKVIVGWAAPKNRGEFGGNIIGTTLKDALYESCITLNLTPTIHEFNIDELGRVEFVINYLAYVEDFFDQPTFNIFSHPEHTKNQLTRKLRFKHLGRQCKASEVNEIKTAEKDDMTDERDLSMQSLIKSMMTSNKVRYMQVPLEVLNDYDEKGPSDPSLQLEAYFAQILGMPTAAMGNIEGEMETRADASKTAGDIEGSVNPIQTISFIYLSDIMDIILEGIEKTIKVMPDAITTVITQISGVTADDAAEEAQNYKRYIENFKRFRLVLGPMEVTNASKAGAVVQSRFVSLGDVPISMRFFIEWLTKKMLKKDEAVYPLPKFTNDFINELLREFLNTDVCFSNAAKQATRLGQTALTAYTDTPGQDELTQQILASETWESWRGTANVPRRIYMGSVKSEDTPVLSVNGQRDNNIIDPGVEKEINYMVYYAARVQPVERMNGDMEEDHARGVWHYQIGRDEGIVKNIQLKKTNSPGLKEVRFEQHGYDGLLQLREMYDATIDTYADVSAFPGNYIYVEPRGFSPGAKTAGWDLTQFGIGGYYMIIRSEHSFGPGEASTDITAKWVAEIEQAAAKKAEADLDAEGSTDDTPAKCYSPGTEGGDDRALASLATGLDAAAKATAAAGGTSGE